MQVDELIISPMFLTLSFKSRMKRQNVLLNALGLAITNVDSTQITL